MLFAGKAFVSIGSTRATFAMCTHRKTLEQVKYDNSKRYYESFLREYHTQQD
jgi:hypothetical protein